MSEGSKYIRCTTEELILLLEMFASRVHLVRGTTIEVSDPEYVEWVLETSGPSSPQAQVLFRKLALKIATAKAIAFDPNIEFKPMPADNIYMAPSFQADEWAFEEEETFDE